MNNMDNERRVDLDGIIFGLHGKPMDWSGTDRARIKHCMRLAIEQILQVAKYDCLLDDSDIKSLLNKID